MKRTLLLPLALLASAALPLTSRADSVNFTLNNATQSGPEGSVFTYQATVFAPTTNTGLEYLNGLSTTTAGGPLTVDTGDFFANFPIDLAPGDTFTGDLFTVTGTPGSAGTTTLGSVVLQGGSAAGAFDALASSGFSAEVTSSAAVTPEPLSLLLAATGAAGMAALRKRRVQAA